MTLGLENDEGEDKTDVRVDVWIDLANHLLTKVRLAVSQLGTEESGFLWEHVFGDYDHQLSIQDPRE